MIDFCSGNRGTLREYIFMIDFCSGNQGTLRGRNKVVISR